MVPPCEPEPAETSAAAVVVAKPKQPKKVRRRLKIIADDSVFIPISDSMMVPSCESEEKADEAENDENTEPALWEEDVAAATPIRKSDVRHPFIKSHLLPSYQ